MDTSIDSLIAIYIAGICGLGYGLRQIVEAQKEHGVEVKEIVVRGGAGQSYLVRQLLADATGLMVTAPKTEEPVLLGSALLGAVASGAYADLTTAMSAMGSEYLPASSDFLAWHTRRYEGFKLLQEVGRKVHR